MYNHEGALVSTTYAARLQGTTVEVKGLFEPLPVRLKEFQRNLKREYGKCIDLLQAYAIHADGVRFLCYHTHDRKT